MLSKRLVVLLLLTRHVMASPRCLLQLFAALHVGVLVIPVEVEGAGYMCAST
jgi:hypothetical protein